MSKITAADRRYWGRIAALGCICCQMDAEERGDYEGEVYPGGIHHVLGDRYGGRKNHRRVFCLCWDHHQSEEEGAISIHGDKLAFEAKYGTELELLDTVLNMLDK